MITIAIASQNPVKINSTKAAFKKVFPKEQIEFLGIPSKSGVPDQPMGNDQTFAGAYNRVQDIRQQLPTADYFIGIEGGISNEAEEMEVYAWIYIESVEQKVGKAKTGNFYLPKVIVDLVNKGDELGTADDKVFGSSNSKQGNGTVGALTNNLISRTDYYEHAIILALIPFINPRIY